MSRHRNGNGQDGQHDGYSNHSQISFGVRGCLLSVPAVTYREIVASAGTTFIHEAELIDQLRVELDVLRQIDGERTSVG